MSTGHTGGHPPYVPPDDDAEAATPEQRHYRRRREDRVETPPTVVSVVGQLVDNKVMMLALAILAFLGGRITGPGERLDAVEREQLILRSRDSVSLADRREIREALAAVLTVLGRAECRRLTEQEASDLGIPCRLLREGTVWPLFRPMRGGATPPPALQRAMARVPAPPAVPPPAPVRQVALVPPRPPRAAVRVDPAARAVPPVVP